MSFTAHAKCVIPGWCNGSSRAIKGRSLMGGLQVIRGMLLKGAWGRWFSFCSPLLSGP